MPELTRRPEPGDIVDTPSGNEDIISLPRASHKICSKCGQDKPRSEYHQRTGGNGMKSRCKECRNRARIAYRSTHLEEMRKRERAWRAANPNRVKAYSAAWRAAHPEQKRAEARAYNATHRGQHAAYQRKYYAAHQERLRARRREYYTKHREKAMAYAKRYRATVAGKATHARDTARRRMQKLGTDVTIRLTAKDWDARIAEYDGRCCWCGKQLAVDEITMDHIIPLSSAGAHIASNVAPSCRHCNATKHAQDWGYPIPGIYRNAPVLVDEMASASTRSEDMSKASTQLEMGI